MTNVICEQTLRHKKYSFVPLISISFKIIFMKRYNRLLLMLFILLVYSIQTTAQKKFPSPPYADTIVNPLKGNQASVADGKVVYTKFCTPCHGEKGKGDGIAAPGLSKPPADHSSAFVQNQKDGALYWIISMGNNPMPAYKSTLTTTQRWQIVNFMRTLAKKH
jgi:mono/diheme cytochrome c family protein